jgi:DNA-binding response OmpR family regulator
VPIIITSAIDNDKDRLKAYKCGVVDYLTKPVSSKDIILKIKKALEYK